MSNIFCPYVTQSCHPVSRMRSVPWPKGGVRLKPVVTHARLKRVALNARL